MPPGNMEGIGHINWAANQFGNHDPLMAPIQPCCMVRLVIPSQRKTVWTGALEWKATTSPSSKMTCSLACDVSIATSEADRKESTWPNKLIMQMIPKTVLHPLSGRLKRSRIVYFNFAQSDREDLKRLRKVLSTGGAGCVHFPPYTQCGLGLLVLSYHSKKQMFIGMIPQNQLDFVREIKEVITSRQRMYIENMVGMGHTNWEANQFGNQDPLMAPIQPPNMVRPVISPQRKTVWTGALEWQEKPKVATTDPSSKMTRSLACNASIATTEADLNTSKWPNKLIMQLIPQTLLNPLSDLFKQSRMVHFNFATSDREALESLLKLLSTGFAGCVHFPPITQCDVRILMLLYNSKKQMFIGMIPKNQLDFVSGIKQVITSSKRQQMMQGAQFTPQPMTVQHSMPTPPQVGYNITNTPRLVPDVAPDIKQEPAVRHSVQCSGSILCLCDVLQ